jgi:hypothetical protein
MNALYVDNYFILKTDFDKCQLGAFKGLVDQKNVVFNSFVYKLGFFWHEWVSSKRE